MRTTGRRHERGAAAVEFGLILPVLMMILLGIMDYGFVFFVHLNITNAAREGARVGVTREDGGQASADAEAAARTYMQAAGIAGNVTASVPNTGNPTVQVDVVIEPFTPLIGFVPTPASLRASAAMRWEMAGT